MWCFSPLARPCWGSSKHKTWCCSDTPLPAHRAPPPHFHCFVPIKILRQAMYSHCLCLPVSPLHSTTPHMIPTGATDTLQVATISGYILLLNQYLLPSVTSLVHHTAFPLPSSYMLGHPGWMASLAASILTATFPRAIPVFNTKTLVSVPVILMMVHTAVHNMYLLKPHRTWRLI